MIRDNRRLFPLAVGAGILCGFVSIWLSSFGPGRELEEATVDWRMRLRPLEPAGEALAYVTITDEDLQIEENGSWPLSRFVHADVIRILRASGASHISFDVFFSEEGNPEHDAALLGAIDEKEGDVTTSYFFTSLIESRISSVAHSEQADDSQVQGSKFGLNPVHTEAFLGIDPVYPFSERLNKNAGFVNVYLEAGDAVVRRVPLLARHGNRLYPGLVLQTVLSHFDVKPDEIQVIPGKHIRLFPEGHPELIIPIDHQFQYRINFTSQSENFHQAITYSDLYLAVKDGEKAKLVKHKVEGRPVVVGLISAGSSDVATTPIGRLPGVLAQATAIANILSGNHLRYLPTWAAWLLGGLCGGLIPLVCFRKRPWLVIVVCLAIGFLVVGGAMIAAKQSWFPPLVSPLVSVFLWMIIGLVASSVKSLAERDFVEKALSRYVSPNVARLALDRSIRNGFDGTKRREITVFFSDIRGFTDWAERSEPEEVTRVLNDYLAAMIPIIQKHGGTLDKFIGDSVMVLFNESGDLKRHSLAAVQMAVEMQLKTREIAASLVNQGREAIAIGIGIHTGFATVGNFGSEQYLDFTAIGTTVNLAARLEGVSEPESIFVSEQVKRGILEEYEVESVGERQLKGLSKAVPVFRVVYE